MSSLFIQLESWKSLIPLSFALTPKLNNPSCAHYSEYHSISSIQASIFFFLKTMVSVCKSYPPLQVWILLIHSQNAAWDFFVRCKSEHVSPYCLQDKVPTHLHGIASLTWSLPSIPDPSLVTWTPPLSIPCNPALWGFSAHKTTLLFSCLWAFACQGAVFLECLSSCCHQKKPYSCCKMQRKHWGAPSSSLTRADGIPFTSQLSFVHPSPTVQGIARCAAIFCSLHLISRTSALQRQTYTYSFCMLKPLTVVKSKIVKYVN